MTLDELLPLVRDARSCREFCWVILANVSARQKHRLAREARDALGHAWQDKTLRHYLAPEIAGARARRAVPPPPPPRPEPTRDFPPPIVDPAALVAAAWVEPLADDTQCDAVVRVLVRMVYLNGGRTNLPHGWLPALRARFASCGREVPPRVLAWYRSHLQDDPLRFERVNAVSPGAVDTPMFRGGMSQADIEQFCKTIPVGRAADPQELAAPTAFLLSD